MFIEYTDDMGTVRLEKFQSLEQDNDREIAYRVNGCFVSRAEYQRIRAEVRSMLTEQERRFIHVN